ncbi:MAG: 16S rRNA (cytidine(1402)-2'-O)-methyltransferase [Candidatus Competibacteraceae bacterium]|nr:16S rRNA (cytidine(1402)-2'-O)-methyltransferase [Candidatus Competibacteraceae bacterium]
MSIEPALYIVATPIGNLGDITLRALEVLREVALIAAEDTRHTRRLLEHFKIDRPLVSLHQHNERQRLPQLLAELAGGAAIALVSDAGTPLISDPGFPLVRAARRQGSRVIPLPGPSSLLAALAVAGLPTDRFVFEGFLPARDQARRQRLEALASEPRTLLFFESSHRIAETVAAMAAILGPQRPAALARELTKLYEQVYDDTLGALVDWLEVDPNRCRGEFVVVVAGAPQQDQEVSQGREARQLLEILLEEGLPVKQATRVAARLTGIKRNVLYRLALEIQG